MVRYTSSIIIPYARDRVFATMSDWRNISVWDMNITKSELSEGQKPAQTGLGTKYNCAFSVGGRDLDVDYECIKYEEPNVAKFLGLASLFRSEDTVVCEPHEENSTKLTMDFNLRFRGILSPLSFALDGAMQKTGPLVMKDIKNFLDEQLQTEQ